MDTRTTDLPELLSHKLITEKNFAEQIDIIAQSLQIKKESLQWLFQNQNHLDSLEKGLQATIDQVNEKAQAEIENATSVEDESPQITDFIALQRSRLQDQLVAINDQLQAKKSGLLAAQQSSIDDAKKEIGDKDQRNFGNDAHQLDLLKKNLIISLHHAARQHLSYWKASVTKKPHLFNEIFSGIARLNDQNQLEYDKYYIDHAKYLPDFDLAKAQDLISDLLKKCLDKDATIIYRGIRDQLDKLSRMRDFSTENGEKLFTLVDGKPRIQFSDHAYHMEQAAKAASKDSEKLITAVKYSEEDKVDDFASDQYVADRQRELRTAAWQVEDGTDQLREIIEHKEKALQKIAEFKQEHDDLLSQLTAFKEFEIYDSRDGSRNLIADLEFSDKQREELIEGLDETLKKAYADLNHPEKIDELIAKRHLFDEKVAKAQQALRLLVDQCITGQLPLTYPDSDFEAVKRHIHELELDVGIIKADLNIFHAERDGVYPKFSLDRADLAQMLIATQKNDWEEDLHQRLGATLLNLGDMAHGFSRVSAFQGTAVDDAVIGYLYDKRQDTLATQKTLEPQPEKQPFWQRHSTLKKVLIGIGIGIAIAAATVAVITPIGLVATAITAIGVGLTVGAIVGGSALLAAAGGFIGGMIGKFQEKKAAQHDDNSQSPSPEPEVATTATTIKSLRESQSDLALEDGQSNPQSLTKAEVIKLEDASTDVTMNSSVEASDRKMGRLFQDHLQSIEDSGHVTALDSTTKGDKGKEEEEPDHVHDAGRDAMRRSSNGY